MRRQKRELGLNITEEQIEEMKAHADCINYDVARAREKVVRHDVMAHVYAFTSNARRRKELYILELHLVMLEIIQILL